MRTLVVLSKRCWPVLPFFLLTSCGFDKHGFLASVGPVAQAQRDHFFSITGWVLVVIVPLFVATPIVLWKYRLGRRGVYRPEWSFSWILETLIWGLPLIIVAILGVNLWQVSHKLDPYDPISSTQPPLDIQVVSLDWKWLFIYPHQRVAAVDELVLPVNRPISFQLTSGTVMQSFMIPRLGGQIYTMPGMVTHLHLLADKPGTYRGLNTQYNGKGFARQKFTARVTSGDDFKQWIEHQQSKPPLDMTAYQELSKRSVLAQPIEYGGVPAKLFQRIIKKVQSTPAAALPSGEPEREHGA